MTLSDQEIRIIEKYRNLLPEFQSLSEKKLDDLFEFQTGIIKMGIN